MASPPPSAFMRLPPEVRNMIYGYCLVVEGCITPYKKNKIRATTNQEHTSRGFTVGLLAVDKVIRREAAAIFYGKNIWSLTIQESYLYDYPDIDIENPPSSITEKASRTIWEVHAALFRRVLIRPDRYDTVGFDDFNAGDAGSLRCRLNPKMSLAERMEAAHSYNFDLMNDCWGSLFNFVLEMPNLVSVTFDVSNLLCLNGCCRLEVLRGFFVFFSECWEDYLRNRFPTEMMKNLKAAYVVGLKNETEDIQTTKIGWRVLEVPWVILTGDRLIGDEEEEETEGLHDDDDDD